MSCQFPNTTSTLCAWLDLGQSLWRRNKSGRCYGLELKWRPPRSFVKHNSCFSQDGRLERVPIYFRKVLPVCRLLCFGYHGFALLTLVSLLNLKYARCFLTQRVGHCYIGGQFMGTFGAKCLKASWNVSPLKEYNWTVRLWRGNKIYTNVLKKTMFDDVDNKKVYKWVWILYWLSNWET